jgi:hypothetical protein
MSPKIAYLMNCWKSPERWANSNWPGGGYFPRSDEQVFPGLIIQSECMIQDVVELNQLYSELFLFQVSILDQIDARQTD